MTAVRDVVAAVVDPELRVVTIDELGILRDVTEESGRVTVTITPTYTGCPAMDVIRSDIRRALAAAGHPESEVVTVLSPAWTTDWISPAGRDKLAAAGVAPPGPAHVGPVDARRAVHALRVAGHDPDQPLRLDRVQGAVAVRGVRRAVRRDEGATERGRA